MRMGRKRKVSTASHISTMLGEMRTMMTTIQMYAKIENAAVTRNTGYSFTTRSSPGGITTMQMLMMTNRLKAAEPTIVEGPSLPACIFRLRMSMMERKISGAEEPSAISERLATVSFHTLGVLARPSPRLTLQRLAVISSMEDMKRSEIIDTPRKQ